ncbi:universal stress protein [Roseivirga sp. BDSF3-8]|uniref:universal stress protein n=1 Tax=Roseivirga sp. BDSF3-8 TaxID=3241598 RepID=UPI003531F88B
MKKLLLPTDFSGCAQNALNYALLISKKLQTDIHLLHVYPPVYNFSSGSEEYEQKQEEDANQKFDELQQKIWQREEFRRISITRETRKGDVISEIIDIAEKTQADLIVMGTLGAGGIKSIIGSNTSEVVHSAPVPVLSIPANFRPDKVRRMIFATDLNTMDIGAITTLAPIISKLKLPLEVVHVYPEHDEEEDMLYRGFVEKVKENIPTASITFHKINTDDVERGLARFTDDYGDAILTMTIYEKEFFHKLLSQDIAEEMVLGGTTPMLVLRGKK